MDEQDLCFLSIVALGQLFRSRALSPVEATRAALARLLQFDDRLNSFITVLEEPALAQARQAEQELGRGVDRGPQANAPLSLDGYPSRRSDTARVAALTTLHGGRGSNRTAAQPPTQARRWASGVRAKGVLA